MIRENMSRENLLKKVKEFNGYYMEWRALYDKCMSKMPDSKTKEDLNSAVELMIENVQYRTFFCSHHSITINEGEDSTGLKFLWAECNYCKILYHCMDISVYDLYKFLKHCKKMNIEITSILDEDKMPYTYERLIYKDKEDSEYNQSCLKKHPDMFEVLKEFFKNIKNV